MVNTFFFCICFCSKTTIIITFYPLPNNLLIFFTNLVHRSSPSPSSPRSIKLRGVSSVTPLRLWSQLAKRAIIVNIIIIKIIVTSQKYTNINPWLKEILLAAILIAAHDAIVTLDWIIIYTWFYISFFLMVTPHKVVKKPSLGQIILWLLQRQSLI